MAVVALSLLSGRIGILVISKRWSLTGRSDMQSVSKRKSARTGLRLGLAGLMLAVGGLTLIPATAADATVRAAGNRHPQLTAEQKTCLEGQGITKPEKGTRPTAEQRAAFKTAATACGIAFSARAS